MHQDYGRSNIEILVADGMSNDGTREKLFQYVSKKYPLIIIDNIYQSVSHGLNLAISNSQHNIIIRMDAHSSYPNNYISQLVYYLAKLNADNVGGVIDTLPGSDNHISHSIANAISHPFGVGNSLFRVGAKDICRVETVPFGCFHKNKLLSLGGYDLDLVRNQDDELNARIIKNGGAIYLIPEIKIKYYARTRIVHLIKMFFQYGLYKPLVIKKTKAIITYRQLIPFIFTVGIIVGSILSFIYPVIYRAYISSTLCYFGISIYIGLKESIRTRRWYNIIYLPFIFSVIHFSYGLGFASGIIRTIFGDHTRRKIIKESR